MSSAEEGSTCGSAPQPFPDRIRFSDRAEAYLRAVADGIAAGDIEVHQLPRSLFDLFFFAFYEGQEAGEEQMRASMNRLAAELARRPPPTNYANLTSHAELERRRAQPARTPTNPVQLRTNRSA